MPTRSTIFDESPALEGPDYVALVIEWDELAEDLEHQLREDPSSLLAEGKPAPAPRSWSRTLTIAAGAIGAIALAWGVLHRLRS